MQRDGRGVGRSSATSTSESAARTEAQPGRSTLTAQLEPVPARTSSPPLFEHGGEWEKIPTGEYALEGGGGGGDGAGIVARAGGASAASQDQLDTVATAAIDRKGTGRAIDSAVRGPVEAQLGTDLGHARVHDDANAQHAARAMGARAFAHGGDVFLGTGESERDPALMAHELTHVAQQTGSGRAQPQRKVTVGATNSPAEAEADAVAAAVTSGAPPAAAALLCDGPPAPGQLRLVDFLARVEPRVSAAANAELGALGSAAGCPYIVQAFAKYRAQPAAAALAMLHRWIPATRAATSIDQLEQLLLARVQQGIAHWKERGTLPADLAAAEPGLAAQAQTTAPASAGGVQRMTLDSLEGELGAGAPVDARVADHVARATGRDVSGARVHTGPTAATKAAEHGATAFAVGQNVVMGSGAPAAGTALGDALLAHELAHTAQQQEAAADPAARRKPIGDEDQAAERDAGLARLGNFAGAVGDVMRTGVQLQRCADNAPKTIDRRAYLETYEPQIAADAAEHLRTLAFGTRDPSITWVGDGAKVFANRIANEIAAPSAPDGLESLVRPELLTSIIDHARLLDEQGSARGPDKYFVAVGIAVGNAVARRTTESLARQLPRYVQAKNAAGGAEPKAADITISHPIDPIVAQALIATPALVSVDQRAFKNLHPDLLGAPKPLAATRNIVWEPVAGSTMWRRVKEPSDVTVEELAQAWLGGPQEAFRITAAHPLYGLAADTRGQDMAPTRDPAQELASLGGDIADEAVLAQAGGSAKPTRSRARILEQMRLNATLLETSLRDAAARFGPLIAGPVASAAARINARAARLAKADDATVGRWDQQVSAQAAILAAAGDGLQADGLRLDLYATQFEEDLQADPGAFKLPHAHRQALFTDAQLWAEALEVSDLVTTARAKLAVAAQHSAMLELEILEQSLGAATEAAHHSDGATTVQGDFDATTVGPREIVLRKRLGQMRAQLNADPAKLDGKQVQATSEEARDLAFEAQVISQATALDAAWKALDDADGVLSTITFDDDDLAALKTEGKQFYAQWQNVYRLIKAGKKTDARTAFEALATNAKFQSYLKRVNDLLKTVQRNHMIAGIIAMVVITVASMGAGSVISGLVGGGSVATTTGTAVSVGLGLGRTAGAIAGFVTEAAVMSTLTHITFTKDRTVGGFLGEFAKTIVLFGAMRGIAAGFKAAGLEKIAEAGFKADATFAQTVKAGGVRVGELVLNGGVGVLEAVIEAKIREALAGGKQLTEDQVKQLVWDTVIQTAVMVLVARVAKSPLETLKIKAAFQGSKWRAALEGHKAEARAIDALTGGKATPDEVVKATKRSQEQLEREIDALEELQATAKNDPKALDGTGLTQQTLGKQIEALRGHHTKLAGIELAFAAQQIGPNHYTCPRENIADVLATHARLSKKAPELEHTDPETGARTWKIFPVKDGPIIRITERMPDWALTATGKRVLLAARRAGMDDAHVFATSDALLKADDALAHHDLDGAGKALEAGGIEPTLRLEVETALKAGHKLQEGRKPIKNEDGSYWDGPTHDVNTLKMSQNSVSAATSDFGGKEAIPIPELARRLKNDGWRGDPIEVVEQPDGSIISLDHRRIVAARMANTHAQNEGGNAPLPEIPVRIYKHSDGFPPTHWASTKADDFVLEKTIRRSTKDGSLFIGDPKGGPPVHRKGDRPANMGQAVLFRAARQRVHDLDRFPETGGRFPLDGTTKTPIIKPPKTPGNAPDGE